MDRQEAGKHGDRLTLMRRCFPMHTHERNYYCVGEHFLRDAIVSLVVHKKGQQIEFDCDRPERLVTVLKTADIIAM